jgi:hypothetical protein
MYYLMQLPHGHSLLTIHVLKDLKGFLLNLYDMEPYVGIYERKLDDRHRLQIPAGFEIKRGDRLYVEKKSEGALACYDALRFRELTKEFGRTNEKFKNYSCLRVEHSHRILLNGEFGLPEVVVVEGRGDHFVVRPAGIRASLLGGLLKLVTPTKRPTG